MKTYKITFRGFALPYDQDYYIKAHYKTAAVGHFRQGNPTAEVVSAVAVDAVPAGRSAAQAGEDSPNAAVAQRQQRLGDLIDGAQENIDRGEGDYLELRRLVEEATWELLVLAKPLQPEGGVTDYSIENSIRLRAMWGTPKQLSFWGDRRRGDYAVTAFYGDGHEWTFSGFSWGYRGTGPRAMEDFLVNCCGQTNAQAEQTMRLLADRMDNDRWQTTDSAMELDAEWTKTHGWQTPSFRKLSL